MLTEDKTEVRGISDVPIVWTEEEFLRTFSISRGTLLVWIAQGLLALRCPDDTYRITASAVNDFVRGRRVDTPYRTVDEAAQYIKRSRQAVYALVKRNRLSPCSGRGGRLLFRQRDLDRFVLGREKRVSES